MVGKDYFWDDLLDHVREQNLVTFVGPNVTVAKVGNVEQTLDSLISGRLAERFPETVSPGMTVDEAVAAFLRHRRDEVELRLYREIYKVVRDLDLMPGDALGDLAAITDLRFFVTTTHDGLLAQAVNEVRPQGRTRELTASSGRPTSEQPSNEPEPSATDTVILSLFGRAAATGQYAIHDEDRLEWLRALIRDEASLPEWLTHQLRTQPMLFVGCEMPDWVGRFLLRMASSTRLSRGGKQFFVVGPPNSHEPTLSRFFETFCGAAQVQKLEKEPTEFVAELRARWEELTKTEARPLPAVRVSGSPAAGALTIFISYMREDGDAAARLCKSIEGLGWDVWLDKHSIRPGDEFDSEVESAIRRRAVRLFLPIISENTEREDEGYVFKEWRAAVDRARGIMGRNFIVPVVVDDDYTGDPSQYNRMPSAFKHFDFGWAPAGEPDQRLIQMLQEEIRKIWRAGAV